MFEILGLCNHTTRPIRVEFRTLEWASAYGVNLPTKFHPIWCILLP